MQKYLDRCYVQVRPHAARRALSFGLGWLIGGSLIATGAIVGSTIPAHDGGVRVYYGMVVFGLVNAAWGAIKLGEYSKWRRLALEDAASHQDET